MIKDHNIAWKTKRVFFPARQMAGVWDDGTTGIPASLGVGAALFAEILADTELAGMQIGAAGDEVYHFWPLPWDFDRDRPFRVRFWFIATQTDADAPIFKCIYKAIAKQAALTDAAATPDETITLGAHTVSTVANSLEVTDWKKSVSNTKITASDLALLLDFECDDLGGGSADEMLLLGAEIEYVIKATADDNKRHITDDEPVS
jgi:hypothetical protein